MAAVFRTQPVLLD